VFNVVSKKRLYLLLLRLTRKNGLLVLNFSNVRLVVAVEFLNEAAHQVSNFLIFLDFLFTSALFEHGLVWISAACIAITMVVATD